MKMIKIVQLATVAMFLAMVIVGLVVLFTAPASMEDYGKLISTIFPVFLTMVVPALIGSPLTDAVRTISEAKAAQLAAAPLART